jgi:hypothetical protein
LPGHNAVEIDKRHPTLQSEAQADVLVVPRVSASIPIPKQTIFAEGVVVRARFPLHDRDGRYAKRDIVQYPRLENALRSHEADALAFVDEPLDEQLSRQDTFFPGELSMLFEELERSDSNLGVVGHRIAALFYE